MTRADRLLVSALAALALLAWPLVAAAGTTGQRVVVSGPLGETRLALAEAQTLEVPGRTGTLVIEVSGGAVSVTEAECPDRVCVRTGGVDAGGAVIACVPNGVVVRVEGGDSDGLDARIR